MTELGVLLPLGVLGACSTVARLGLFDTELGPGSGIGPGTELSAVVVCC